jgi:hypothetical protein
VRNRWRGDHEQLILAAQRELIALRYGARAEKQKQWRFRMRKLIIAATALAFIASPAFAQTAGTDKGAAPAARSADTGADAMTKH